jgi:hypothetical protein
VIHDERELKRLHVKTRFYILLDLAEFIMSITLLILHVDCYRNECNFGRIYIFYCCTMVLSFASLATNVWVYSQIRIR